MMDILDKVLQIIGQPESSTLEYKAVLPPSRNIAQIICSFANAEGGFIILGVSDKQEVVGLSSDFHATSITHKALDLLSPTPRIQYQYVSHQGKNLYVIHVEKSDEPVFLEGKKYIRVGAQDKLENPTKIDFGAGGNPKIKHVSFLLESHNKTATSAKYKLIEHYQSILKIMDSLSNILYPIGPDTPTDNQEGKILSRILFSSIADTFESYLSDLLYEIFLAKPETLKSKQQITVKEVLDCSDLQDFVNYVARDKIAKLQKGSVKGFVKDNQQIKSLEIIDSNVQDEIEKILQIRHLYSHRNGIVDEKFLKHFSGEFDLNAEHSMSINEACDKLIYLADIANKIDMAASNKYRLACIN